MCHGNDTFYLTFSMEMERDSASMNRGTATLNQTESIYARQNIGMNDWFQLARAGHSSTSLTQRCHICSIFLGCIPLLTTWSSSYLLMTVTMAFFYSISMVNENKSQSIKWRITLKGWSPVGSDRFERVWPDSKPTEPGAVQPDFQIGSNRFDWPYWNR